MSSIAGFFKLNSSLATGVYTVRAYNQFVPVVSTSFKFVGLLNDPVNVLINFPQALYKLGDTVRAIATVTLPGGLPLPLTASVSYNVTFGSSVVANTTVALSALGVSLISFPVPAKITTQNPVVTLTVRNGNTTYVYSQTFNVLNADLYVVDFFPATGYLTVGIPNKVYFQAWTNSSRVETLDISGASLKQVINKTLNATYYSNSISTIAKGKGSFMYTPTAIVGAGNVTFEFVVSGASIVRNVTFLPSAFQSTLFSEAQVAILNANRVLNNREDLLVQIQTNGSVNVSETYILQIRNGEQILFQDQYNLIPNTVRNITVGANSFNLVNGGILSLSLFKVNRVLENFYRSAMPATTAPPATTVAPATTAAAGTTVAATTTKASGATTAAPATTVAATTTKAAAATTAAATTVAATTTKASAATTAAPATTVAATTTKASGATTAAPATTVAATTTKASGATTAAPATTAGVTTAAATTTRPANTTVPAPTSRATFLSFQPPEFANASITSQFLDPKGELLFYKRASDQLQVSIVLDKATGYLPGDTVTYTVNVLNITTQKAVAVDTYISLTAVDVRGIEGDVSSVQTIISRQILVGAIRNYDSELHYSQSLLLANLGLTNTSNNYFDAVLGVQQWRVGAFDVRSLLNVATLVRTAAQSDIDSILSLYKSSVLAQTRPAIITALNAIRSGLQGATSAGLDYMTGITSARSWVHPKRAGWNTTVLDKTQTVHFTSMTLAKLGTYKGTFVLNDDFSNYQLSADVLTTTGVLGTARVAVSTKQYISFAYTLPTFLAVGDSLKVTATIVNAATAALTVSLAQLVNDTSYSVVFAAPKISVAAGATVVTSFNINALSPKVGATFGTSAIGVAAVGGLTYTASSSGSFNIVARDFIFKQMSLGGLIGSAVKITTTGSSASLPLAIPADANSTNQQFTLDVYPTIQSLLEASRKTLVAGPQINFEQTVAALYPLIHRLNQLKTLTLTSDVYVQISQLTQTLQSQYSAIVASSVIAEASGVRVASQSLSFEAITAYALIFFVDLNTATAIVDSSLLTGLQNYLISRKNGKSGFLQTTLSSSSVVLNQPVHDAFVSYALAYANPLVNLVAETAALKLTATAQTTALTPDSHFFALLANTLYLLKRPLEAVVYTDALIKLQSADGSVSTNSTSPASLNGATGLELTLQTTSLAVLAWNNNLAKYTSQVTNATNYLFGQVQGGVVGSTTANSFFLKVAVAQFATLQSINGNATLVLSVNGRAVANQTLTANSVDALSFPLQSLLAATQAVPGTTLQVNLDVVNASLVTGALKDFRVLYSLNYKYTSNSSYVPPPPISTTPAFNVVLTVGKTPIGLDAQTGKYFNYTVTLANIFTTGSASGAVNVAIGAPSCLSLDLNYANSLVNSQQITGYEIVDNSVTVLLLRSMALGEVRTLNIQYIQNFGGNCLLRDNVAYQNNGNFSISAATKIV